MQGIPPVQVLLGNGRCERIAVLLLHTTAAGALAAGLVARHLPGWPLMGSGGCVVIAAALAGAAWGVFWLRPARGRLTWDGAAWSWSPDDAPLTKGIRLPSVALRLDLGPWLLLRWRVPGRRQAVWCGLGRQQAGAGWHGLRLALYQPSQPPSTRRAPGAVATPRPA